MYDSAKQFLLDEDRGVSPVIGVILMVAITVILAAVIATFVMNMGPSDTGPENAQLEFANKTDGSDVYYELKHDRGDSLTVGEYKIEVIANGSVDDEITTDWHNEFDTMTAGDTFNLGAGRFSPPGTGTDFSTNATDVDEVRVVWESPDSDRTEIVREWSP